MLDEIGQDIRYGFRTLAKSYGFSTVAVLTLALGIGANSAIFSFVDGVLLKPLPYPDPERILQVWEKVPGGGNNGVSTANFLDWQHQSDVFEEMVATTGGSMRRPYGRHASASAATLARYSGERTRTSAFTLLTTDPLMPTEAFARA